MLGACDRDDTPLLRVWGSHQATDFNARRSQSAELSSSPSEKYMSRTNARAVVAVLNDNVKHPDPRKVRWNA